MPVTLLAAALAALLAAEPAATEPPSPAEWGPDTGAPSAAAPPQAPPSTRPLPPMPHSISHVEPRAPDWMLAAGWGATSLMGVTATGVEATFEAGQPFATPSPALTLVTADLFVGETTPGLAIRSFAVGAEVWYDGGRLRAGGGLGLGLVSYRRATSGEWDFNLTVGLRAGVELALLRVGSSDVVLGAHGAASLGSWYSGYFTLGWRWRTAPR